MNIIITIAVRNQRQVEWKLQHNGKARIQRLIEALPITKLVMFDNIPRI